MAYLPGFKYDVFLSYSGIDDVSANTKRNKGLITKVYDKLKITLQQQLGNEPEIYFMDVHAVGNEDISEQISVIQESAILLSFVSPTYLKSNWCKKEIDLFLKKIQKAPDIKGRIFIVYISGV